MNTRANCLPIHFVALALIACKAPVDPDERREEVGLARVSASELCDDNAGNSVRARSKYSSNRIAVELLVEGVDTWMQGSKLRLSCGRSDVWVNAIFTQESNDAIARLKTGDAVIVDCIVADTGTFITLDACALVRQPTQAKHTPEAPPRTMPLENPSPTKSMIEAERAADAERYRRLLRAIDSSTPDTSTSSRKQLDTSPPVAPARGTSGASSGATSVIP